MSIFLPTFVCVVMEGGPRSPCVPSICHLVNHWVQGWWAPICGIGGKSEEEWGQHPCHSNGHGAQIWVGVCLYFFIYRWMNVCIHNHWHCYCQWVSQNRPWPPELWWQTDGQSDTGSKADPFPWPLAEVINWDCDPFQWSLHRSQRVSGFGDGWRETEGV